MGHFGTSSHANDTCWDVLARFRSEEEGGFPKTQAQVDAMMAWIAAGFPGDYQTYYRMNDESDTILGPVVWCLEEGFAVDRDMLGCALGIARARRRSKSYLACWGDGEERKDALAEEIKMIREELKRLAKLEGLEEPKS